MERLKWVAVAALAVLAGYYGHKLTSGWAGAAVAGLGAGFFLTMLLQEQWITAVITLFAGVYGVFSLIGSAPEPEPVKPVVQAVQAPSAKDGEGIGLPAPDKGGAEKVDGNGAKSLSPMEGKSGGKDGGKIIKDCAVCPDLVAIPSGQFNMGSPTTKAGSAAGAGVAPDAREAPVHAVVLRGFALGRSAVTKGEFAAFATASQYKTDAERDGNCVAWIGGKWDIKAGASWRQSGLDQSDDHPAVCLSWNDAQAYTAWLSKQTHQNYRLPSEAEREYATRAGSSTLFWWGDTLAADKANYDTLATDFQGSHKGIWRASTVSASSFAPNAFGLFNVHGNVWEWVQDCAHDSYAGAPADGKPWVDQCAADKRVLRGGAWVGDPSALRSASRAWFPPDFHFQASGFRVARDLAKTP